MHTTTETTSRMEEKTCVNALTQSNNITGQMIIVI